MPYSVKNLADAGKIFKELRTAIFYITNTADRGLGLENIIPDYHIICIDYDDEVDYLEKRGVKIFCLEKKLGKKNIIFRNSAVLLARDEVKKYIKENSSKRAMPAIAVFKPSLAVEKIAAENNWKILNNPAALSKELENKLNFIFIAKSLKIRIPEAEIIDLSRISYWELKKYYDYFVIQLQSGNAGSNTFFIRNNADFIRILDNFSKNSLNSKIFPARVSKFIKGISATVNACVYSGGIYKGKPCFQITGEELCTNNAGATCGNDWGAMNMSKKAMDEIDAIMDKIGRYLQDKGYKGIFGLDFIISEKNEDVYLIEINPRFVASVPCYTKLEIKESVLPMLALHFLEFLGVKYEIGMEAKNLFLKNTVKISGSQLILRNKKKSVSVICGEAMSGVYNIVNSKINFLRSGYSPLDLKNAREFIILAASKGRNIKPENEVARIESAAPLVSKDYHLTADAELITRQIYEKLIIKII